MKLLLQAIFFIFFAFNTQANENISKLNSLYLNGVLDKDTYFKSIEGLGIDTSNQIFINLFELFKQGIIDQKSYESSLSNLTDLAMRQPEEKVKNSTKSIIDNTISESNETQTYLIENCNGNFQLCIDVREVTPTLEFIYKNNEVILTDLTKNFWVELGLDFAKFISEEYQDNGRNFYIIAQYSLKNGNIVTFKYLGTLNENSFLVNNLQIIAVGKIVSSFKLKKI